MRAVPPAAYSYLSLVCRWDARCKNPLPRYKSFGKERGDRQQATRAVGASPYRFLIHVAREPRWALWFFDPFGGRGPVQCYSAAMMLVLTSVFGFLIVP